MHYQEQENPVISSSGNVQSWYEYLEVPPPALRDIDYTGIDRQLHREDGPAVITTGEDTVTYEWYLHGRRENLDGPQKQVIKKDTGQILYEQWGTGITKHREDGPAVRACYYDGTPECEEYWVNGELSREDGPALSQWYESGKPRREKWATTRLTGPVERWWRKDGSIWAESYDPLLPDGTTAIWYGVDDRDILGRKIYDKKTKILTITTYRDGVKASETLLGKTLLDGIWSRRFYKSGQVAVEKSRPGDVEIFYRQDGTILYRKQSIAGPLRPQGELALGETWFYEDGHTVQAEVWYDNSAVAQFVEYSTGGEIVAEYPGDTFKVTPEKLAKWNREHGYVFPDLGFETPEPARTEIPPNFRIRKRTL